MVEGAHPGDVCAVLLGLGLAVHVPGDAVGGVDDRLALLIGVHRPGDRLGAALVGVLLIGQGGHRVDGVAKLKSRRNL